MHSFTKILIRVIVTSLLVILSDAKNCTCMPFFQCSDNDEIISDGRGLIEIRRTKECDGIFDMCCTTPITTTTEKPATTPKGCGYLHSGTFPWAATLLFKPLPSYVPVYKCRVSLIHGQVALTAAHCLPTKGYYQVKINGVLRSVIHSQVHPSFNPGSLQNDIALLVLNKPFKVEKTGTVCVPPIGTVLDGTKCTVATTGSKTDVKVIDVPVVPKTECEESLKKTQLGKFFHLHDSFICAGGEADQDTCGGDGGTPLICPVAGLVGRYQQVGIVSWGVGCGQSVPGVYVNLAHFREWIDGFMLDNGFDLISYRV